jgi:predicted nucleic acid-binding protein
VLLDTNVVLDVLLQREPHFADSAAVLGVVESGLVTGLLGATSVTTIYYLIDKALGARRARRHIETLLSLCEVAPVGEEVLREALALGFADYEDAVLHEAARRARAQGIVTRDQSGFRRAELPVYTPDELLTTLRHRR